MSGGNVFRQLYAPTEADYVAAVRKVVLALSQHHTHKTIAQRLGISAKTVHNAQEGKTVLDGWVIPRIAWEFGPEAVKPVRDLGGGEIDRAPALTDALRPHVEALAFILDEQSRSRLTADATRGLQ